MILYSILAWLLMGLCVAIHAMGIMGVLRWHGGALLAQDSRFWPATWRLIRIAGGLILLHIIEIFLWASLYVWVQALPDLSQAFYFSSVTYTTVGYGDLVLPVKWRLFGAVEALTGIILCGWSTGFFVVIVNRIGFFKNADMSEPASEREKI